jgi:hypothetical protein
MPPVDHSGVEPKIFSTTRERKSEVICCKGVTRCTMVRKLALDWCMSCVRRYTVGPQDTRPNDDDERKTRHTVFGCTGPRFA